MTNKKPFWFALLFIPLSLFQAKGSIAETEQVIAPLPESLGQWYKPVNKRQVWLHTMFVLRRELQAIDDYAAEEEPELARKWGDRFVEHLRRLPEMVPEWEDGVELGEALRLESALRAADFKTVRSAVSRLRRNCRNCHREYRALAALKYRSPDFSRIEIADAEGEVKDYGGYMESLSNIVNRIKIASEDQRWSRAAEASARLRDALHGLGQSCESCHKDDLPRQRILGEASERTLDELEQALVERQTKTTGRKLGEAAVVICARCHGIHRTMSDARNFLFE
ncbi:MAG: hypothetical protein ABW096_00595 [Candidatus Thiodiazotropha sp.]